MNMKIMKNKQRKTKHAVKTVAVFNKRHSVHKLLFTSTDKPVFLVKFIIDFYFSVQHNTDRKTYSGEQ